MVLTDCEIIEAECICLLIDNGLVSNEICNEFMTSVYHKNHEMFALLDWMLMRWVSLRKHKLHLPTRKKQRQSINLANLIHSNST